MPKFALWFKDIDKSDLSLIGEKAADLGEMYNADLPIPNGFVVTPYSYQHFLKENKLDLKIRHILSTANFNHLRSLHQISEITRQLIMDSPIPNDLITEIMNYYRKLGEPHVSIQFSGESPQFEAILNVKGDAVLLDKIKFAWSQNFNLREIFIRHGNYFENTGNSGALIIQQMFISNKYGVLYTGDLKTNTSGVIEGAQHLNDQQANELKYITEKIKRHLYFPHKIEWMLVDNKFYIGQALPIVDVVNEQNTTKAYENNAILNGISVNKGIACGPVKIVLSKEDAENTDFDDILVIKEIKSFFLPAFKKASAVVIENFDKNIQILFDSNELKLPCVANAVGATTNLKNGKIITVNASKGEIYQGGFSISSDKQKSFTPNIETVTKLYIKYNESAAEISNKLKSKISGVLICDADKIIKQMGIHPKKLIAEHSEQMLIDKLIEYLTGACREFNTTPVIYQLTNLTTADYRNLEGGSGFEEEEKDSSMGFRGAFRFIHQPELLNLEINAIKKTREKFNCKNLSVTIPYVRTPDELNEIKQIFKSNDLTHSDDFKIMMTVDIPSNIIELEKFVELGLDGIMINYESLNSLLTGTSNKNSEISAEVNRFDNSLLWALEQIIKTANKFNLPITVFSDTSLDIHSLVDDLIPLGINSICVPAQNTEQSFRLILETERRFAYRGY